MSDTKNNGYNGNPRIKSDLVQESYTAEQVQEYLRCMVDIEYFCEKYIQVNSLDEGMVNFKLRGYQSGMIKHFNENRFSIVLAPRQSGKSITACAYICHYAIFNQSKKIAILANKGAIAREMLARITTMLESIPFFLQPGVRILNKGNIVFSHGTEILAAATSSSSIRGLSINLLLIDEFGFVQRANEFYTSTYPVITSGESSRVIIASTPNGTGNMYYNLWQSAVQGGNDFKPFRVLWNEIPGRDEAWKAKTIANTSELQFRQEFSGEFIGSAQTLISSECLLGLRARNPYLCIRDIRYYDDPIEGHAYIMLVDVGKGRGQDYSTFTIIDTSVNPFKQVCTYRCNTISPLLFPEYIVRTAKKYNMSLVIIENNDAGQVVANAVYYDYEYDNLFVSSTVKSNGIGVTMSKKVKRIGCSNLKDLLESGRLELCDADTISELSSFVPKGDSFAATGIAHDDMVMNLVMFAWFAGTTMFTDMSNHDLKELLYAEKIQQIEEDLPPFGFLSTGSSNTGSMAIHERMTNELREWNSL